LGFFLGQKLFLKEQKIPLRQPPKIPKQCFQNKILRRPFTALSRSPSTIFTPSNLTGLPERLRSRG
jgi:hypothetical protein